MDKKIVLSIAIPTWNRAKSLESLLHNIFGQMKGIEGEVEVCISNNGSTDNTSRVVKNFQNKYPNLIKYHQNEKNLGFDANLLAAINLSVGQFIWTFGDDDIIIEGGLTQVVNLIKKSSLEKVGLIFVRREQYFIKKETGEKIVCANTVDKQKPELFTMDKKDVMGFDTPDSAFMTALVLNGQVIRDILKSENSMVANVTGFNYIQVFLHSLMFLKYPNLKAISLNKVIVLQELPVYKYFIEDNFKIDYELQKKLNNVLLSCNYINNTYAPIFIHSNNKLRKRFIITMIKMRALESFNYHSYTGCVKMFFDKAPFFDALIFSCIFSILFLFPIKLLQSAYKLFLAVKYKKDWASQWVLAYDTTKGSRPWKFDSEK